VEEAHCSAACLVHYDLIVLAAAEYSLICVKMLCCFRCASRSASDDYGIQNTIERIVTNSNIDFYYILIL